MIDKMPDREVQTATPSAQPPEETDLVQITPLSKSVGGLPAIVSAVRSAWNEMGPLRGLRTLRKLNQQGGIDCPGCAWPEPDKERSHAEFCENGLNTVGSRDRQRQASLRRR